MPFASEKQRRWMHANHPEMAKRWEAEEKSGDYRRGEKNPLRERAIREERKRRGKRGKR